MKTKFLLTLAGLTVLAVSASAASPQVDADVLLLPKYVVTAPRHQPLEENINASLSEFRQKAQKPVTLVEGLAGTDRLVVPVVLEKLRAVPAHKTVRIARLTFW